MGFNWASKGLKCWLPQPANKYSIFSAIQMFISVFTTAHHFPSAGSIPSTASYAFCKTHFSIIFPSTLRSSIYSLSLMLPHQNPACTSVPHTCHMHRQSHPPWFSQPTNFWAVLLITTLLITQFSPLSSLSPFLPAPHTPSAAHSPTPSAYVLLVKRMSAVLQLWQKNQGQSIATSQQWSRNPFTIAP